MTQHEWETLFRQHLRRIQDQYGLEELITIQRPRNGVYGVQFGGEANPHNIQQQLRQIPFTRNVAYLGDLHFQIGVDINAIMHAASPPPVELVNALQRWKDEWENVNPGDAAEIEVAVEREGVFRFVIRYSGEEWTRFLGELVGITENWGTFSDTPIYHHSSPDGAYFENDILFTAHPRQAEQQSGFRIPEFLLSLTVEWTRATNEYSWIQPTSDGFTVRYEGNRYLDFLTEVYRVFRGNGFEVVERSRREIQHGYEARFRVRQRGEQPESSTVRPLEMALEDFYRSWMSNGGSSITQRFLENGYGIHYRGLDWPRFGEELRQLYRRYGHRIITTRLQIWEPMEGFFDVQFEYRLESIGEAGIPVRQSTFFERFSAAYERWQDINPAFYADIVEVDHTTLHVLIRTAGDADWRERTPMFLRDFLFPCPFATTYHTHASHIEDTLQLVVHANPEMSLAQCRRRNLRLFAEYATDAIRAQGGNNVRFESVWTPNGETVMVQYEMPIHPQSRDRIGSLYNSIRFWHAPLIGARSSGWEVSDPALFMTLDNEDHMYMSVRYNFAVEEQNWWTAQEERRAQGHSIAVDMNINGDLAELSRRWEQVIRGMWMDDALLADQEFPAHLVRHSGDAMRYIAGPSPRPGNDAYIGDRSFRQRLANQPSRLPVREDYARPLPRVPQAISRFCNRMGVGSLEEITLPYLKEIYSEVESGTSFRQSNTEPVKSAPLDSDPAELVRSAFGRQKVVYCQKHVEDTAYGQPLQWWLVVLARRSAHYACLIPLVEDRDAYKLVTAFAGMQRKIKCDDAFATWAIMVTRQFATLGGVASLYTAAILVAGIEQGTTLYQPPPGYLTWWQTSDDSPRMLALYEAYGWERLFDLYKEAFAFTRSDPDWRNNWESAYLSPRLGNCRVLEVTCPSTGKRDYLYVHAHCQTALAAVAWTFNMTGEEYQRDLAGET